MIYWRKSTQALRGSLAITLRQATLLLGLVCCVWLASTARASMMHPELVEHDVTDLDFIFEISKFRSGAGHDFSYFKDVFSPAVMAVIGGIDNFFATDVSEPESSMKHYYSPYASYKQENGDNTTIPVYAPFSGTITRVIEETREADPSIVNKRVEITSSNDTDYTVVFFHLNLDDVYPQTYNDYPDIPGIWEHQIDDSVYTTLTVEDGDFLGYADMRLSNDFDIAVLFNDSTDDKWISLFELMPDSLFAAYETRGANRSDTIISKAYRQNNPVTWGLRNDDDWMTLGPVPEPNTLSLLMLGTLVLLCWRR